MLAKESADHVTGVDSISFTDIRAINLGFKSPLNKHVSIVTGMANRSCIQGHRYLRHQRWDDGAQFKRSFDCYIRTLGKIYRLYSAITSVNQFSVPFKSWGWFRDDQGMDMHGSMSGFKTLGKAPYLQPSWAGSCTPFPLGATPTNPSSLGPWGTCRALFCWYANGIVKVNANMM